MFSRKLTILASSLLIPIVMLVLGLTIRVKDPLEAYDDVPAYAARGPYQIGVRTLTADSDSPLDITIWYPAQPNDTHPSETTYPYQIKIGPPLGSPSLATFTGQANPDAEVDLAGGPYPLVILSPGFAFSASTYGWQAEHLASYGFVVMAPEHQETLDPETHLWRSTVTRPQDVLKVLAYVDHQVVEGGRFEGLIDAETVAVIGHSYGGYTALAAAGARIDTQDLTEHCEREANDPAAWLCDMLLPHLDDMAELAGLDGVPEGLWPAWADPRVDAVVPMAGDAFHFGQAGLVDVSVPVLAMGGTADADSPFLWSAHPTYEYVSSPTKARVAFEGGEHMLFTARCESTPLLLTLLSGEFCDDAVWDRQQAHDLVNHFTTAFLLTELKQDTEAAEALSPEAVNFPDVTYAAQGY